MSTHLNLSKIPEHMHEGIQNYIEQGLRPGSFLYNIFCNDFVHAAGQSDDINRNCLLDYAILLYNDFPIPSWGNEGKVNMWIAMGGMNQYKIHGVENA